MQSRWSYVAVWANICLTLGYPDSLKPKLTKDMNNLALQEGTRVGTIVYKLKGVDPEGLPIRYSLVGTDKFSVDAYTGDVTLIRPLDREEQATIDFLVTVEAEETEREKNLVQPVTVIVLDENDTPPMFKKRLYEIYVRENEPVGKIVLDDIEVFDEDLVGHYLNVRCEDNEQWPDACRTFSVVDYNSTRNHYMGVLVLKKNLDYSERQFYRYQMSAYDGKYKSTAHVEIKVVDVQNTPPVFQGPLSAVIPEDASVGSLVMVVKARDGDIDNPREVVLELVRNPLEFFALDTATGELRIARPLDRDELPNRPSPITLVVRATEIVNGAPLDTEQTSRVATIPITIRKVEDGIIDPDSTPVRYRLLGDGRMPHSRQFVPSSM